MKNDFLRSFHLDFAVATCLLTRFPMPTLPDEAFKKSARAVWAYPLVGFVLAGVTALIWMLLMRTGLPTPVSAGLVLACLIGMTGAMHEDGLSDCADGFWGGHDRARRLEIMKDSQIGTYGTLALIIATGLRWICYATLLPVSLVPLFVAAVLSRAMMPLAMAVLPHARDNGLSHSVGRPGSLTVVAGLLIALMATLFLAGPLALLGGLSALISAAGVIWLAHRKIAGQTGDVLGAIQQISEITILITYTVLAL